MKQPAPVNAIGSTEDIAKDSVELPDDYYGIESLFDYELLWTSRA